eukprot:15468382-Alexandrium_andersonii.AAC.1
MASESVPETFRGVHSAPLLAQIPRIEGVANSRNPSSLPPSYSTSSCCCTFGQWRRELNMSSTRAKQELSCKDQNWKEWGRPQGSRKGR